MRCESVHKINLPEGLGADEGSVLRRFGSLERYRRFLRMLPEDDNADRLERAVREEDYGEAFRCAHTLKGLAATLELGPLLETAVCLTEELRRPPYDERKIREECRRLRQEMDRCCRLIRRI